MEFHREVRPCKVEDAPQPQAVYWMHNYTLMAAIAWLYYLIRQIYRSSYRSEVRRKSSVRLSARTVVWKLSVLLLLAIQLCKFFKRMGLIKHLQATISSIKHLSVLPAQRLHFSKHWPWGNGIEVQVQGRVWATDIRQNWLRGRAAARATQTPLALRNLLIASSSLKLGKAWKVTGNVIVSMVTVCGTRRARWSLEVTPGRFWWIWSCLRNYWGGLRAWGRTRP